MCDLCKYDSIQGRHFAHLNCVFNGPCRLWLFSAKRDDARIWQYHLHVYARVRFLKGMYTGVKLSLYYTATLVCIVSNTPPPFCDIFDILQSAHLIRYVCRVWLTNLPTYMFICLITLCFTVICHCVAFFSLNEYVYHVCIVSTLLYQLFFRYEWILLRWMCLKVGSEMYPSVKNGYLPKPQKFQHPNNDVIPHASNWNLYQSVVPTTP